MGFEDMKFINYWRDKISRYEKKYAGARNERDLYYWKGRIEGALEVLSMLENLI